MLKALLIAFKAYCFNVYGNYLGEATLDENRDGSYEITTNAFHYHLEPDSVIDGITVLPTDPIATCTLRASTEA